MIEKHLASNGWSIAAHGEGGLSLARPGLEGAILHNAQVDALREFFQRDADDRLGRWRWPEDPDYVVYRYNENWVNVLDEHDGTSKEYLRIDIDATRDAAFPMASERAARAYFDAHPEPKPWHRAQHGEVWQLEIDGREELALTCPDGEKFQLSSGDRVPLDSPLIEAATRIG